MIDRSPSVPSAKVTADVASSFLPEFLPSFVVLSLIPINQRAFSSHRGLRHRRHLRPEHVISTTQFLAAAEQRCLSETFQSRSLTTIPLARLSESNSQRTIFDQGKQGSVVLSSSPFWKSNRRAVGFQSRHRASNILYLHGLCHETFDFGRVNIAKSRSNITQHVYPSSPILQYGAYTKWPLPRGHMWGPRC